MRHAARFEGASALPAKPWATGGVFGLISGFAASLFVYPRMDGARCTVEVLVA